MPQKARTESQATRLLIVGLAFLVAICAAVFAVQSTATADRRGVGSPECATGVGFLGFSDALNKRTYEGTSVGGLSALAYTGRRDTYYSLVDNGPTAASEARFYTLRIPLKKRLGTPELLDVTTLKDASGQPFTASDFDGEGLALTRRRDLLASSETEPSIRRFDPDGNLIEELPVPQKFEVAP
jgi:hypothetical protein